VTLIIVRSEIGTPNDAHRQGGGKRAEAEGVGRREEGRGKRE
jgi:hypothetical protein